ncbi:MAG: hypothetical protein AB7O62_02520 [Pirellulales bacterium]
MTATWTRREALNAAAVAAGGTVLGNLALAHAAGPGEFRLSTFKVDISPRIGMPQYSGAHTNATAIDDPIWAKGVVLLGGEQPVVLCSFDWCEIRNESYLLWQKTLAEAAGTTPGHVLITSIHQHDTPLGEVRAQEILEEYKVVGKVVDMEYHQQCLDRVAAALKESLSQSQPVTHYGVGQAKVERVASTRRVVLPDGKVTFSRYSRTSDATLQSLPDGDIDPWLKTISFWNGEQALLALSMYSTHPMSYYGGGRVSCEFVGLAREQREQDDPQVPQIYVSGCSGDVTAGKYNDGQTANRGRLAERMYQGMLAAWKATEKRPLRQIEFRSTAVLLPHREGPGLSAQDQERDLSDPAAPFARKATAAMLLSSLQRNAQGHAFEVPSIDLGGAQIVLLPAEAFVGYQHMAQRLRPDDFVMAIGYGECSSGYIPLDKDIAEGFVREHGYCYAAENAEELLTEALTTVLQARR